MKINSIDFISSKMRDIWMKTDCNSILLLFSLARVVRTVFFVRIDYVLTVGVVEKLCLN